MDGELAECRERLEAVGERSEEAGEVAEKVGKSLEKVGGICRVFTFVLALSGFAYTRNRQEHNPHVI